MKKKIDPKKTLAYAVAFHFCNSGNINFMMKGKIYQHINTIYDQKSDNGGYNTLEVVYDYKAQKYIVLVVSDEKFGNVEISIL